MIHINLLDTSDTGHLLEAERRHEFFWAIVISCILAASAVVCVLQTEWFVRRCQRPGGGKRVRLDMAHDGQAQRRRRDEYLKENAVEPPPGIQIHERFNDNEERWIRQEIDGLKSDMRLREELRNQLGFTFDDLHVEVVPAWEMTLMNGEFFGVTPEGWKDADDNRAWGFNVKGLTVRERHGRSRRATDDGRPRIALHPWSFRSRKTLRLALFHELLHSLNVPGYKASSLTRVQSDLAYLPLYRSYVKRHRLNSSLDDKVIALFLTGLLIMLGRCVYVAFTMRPRRGPRLS